MERIPAQPPVIAPLPACEKRPLVSVMIPVYNCSAYLAEALQSVLQQDLGAELMQIEVIDDFSTDADVAQLVAEIGKGRINYFRQLQNVGSLRNFETAINRAKGTYVHLLHGDDWVKPGFYQHILGLFEAFPQAGAAFCAFDMMKDDGSSLGSSDKAAATPSILDNWLIRLAERPWLQYACIVVKRSVYEHLGSFYMATYGEDWEMWVRIAKHYPMAYTPESLAVYRVHTQSITGQSIATGANVRDMGRIITRISEHVPEKEQVAVRQKALKYYAHYSLNICGSLWYRSGNKQAVLAQINEALRLHKDPYLIWKARQIKTLMLLPKNWLPAVRKIVRSMQAAIRG